MRYQEITEKARFRQPVLMFHGTSALYLRSILKQGVIPNPKQRTWADDPQASLAQTNRTSLHGSYWTSNYTTAHSAGFTAARKFGGNVLIVMAQIAEGSAYADEDSLNLRWPWAAMMHDCGVVPDAYAYAAYIYFARSRSTDPEYRAYENEKLDKQREKMVQDFAKHLHDNAKAPARQPLDLALARAAFEAYLIRHLAFSPRDHWSPLRDVPEEDRPVLPTPEEADAKLLAIQDKLTRRYRQSAFKGDQFNHTLRMPIPVGYSGGNKIICIVEELKRMYDEPRLPNKLWYGQPPEEYLRQYRERIGRFPGLIDGRTGKELMPADPEKTY